MHSSFWQYTDEGQVAPCSLEKVRGSILRIVAAAPSISNLWQVTNSPIASCVDAARSCVSQQFQLLGP